MPEQETAYHLRETAEVKTWLQKVDEYTQHRVLFKVDVDALQQKELKGEFLGEFEIPRRLTLRQEIDVLSVAQELGFKSTPKLKGLNQLMVITDITKEDIRHVPQVMDYTDERVAAEFAKELIARGIIQRFFKETEDKRQYVLCYKIDIGGHEK